MTPLQCIECLVQCPRDPGGHGHLEDTLIDRCQRFRGHEIDAVRFLREILDEVVRYAHGSSFTIILIRGALEPYPESDTEKDTRRTFYEKSGRWPTGAELDRSDR